ncbi:MAG TPA: type IV-A pilus assembly ATPase PilB [Bdellovibrionota bacterium]|nr:type IV-A pilus assembly ATPase PilB [Bdellovibrionota bacterium]
MSKALAELLMKDRVITQQHLADVMQAAGNNDNHAQLLIEKGYVSETKLVYYLGRKFGLPSINLAKFEVRPEIISLVPPDLARKHRCVPIQANQGTLVVAVADPTQVRALEELKFRVKMNVEAVITSFSALDGALAKYYGGAAFIGAAVDSFQKEKKKEERESGASADMGIELVEVHDISSSDASEAPVIALVNGVLGEAIRKGASDIHVEPYEKSFRVRLRIDGTLVEMAKIPLDLKRAVTARFKIMSRMDIAESRVPQDGRIKLKAGGKEIDFRVNSLPTLFGEKIVARLLSKGNLQLDMTKLGFETRQLEVFKKGIYSANGMVLVTGPTGSGKTTTLYSALQELNQMSDNVSTVEDPVEYNLEGINQTQVHKEVGLTFANVLRALLRQDPDVILLGEIRDYETAEVGVQAALTGHLVLSTLHTNDAASTITRLMNMGLEPFLVVAAVNVILAQRLLRKVCSQCRTEDPVPKEKLIEQGFSKEAAAQIKTYKGAGCKVCNNTGYKGRVAIYEVLDFSPTLKEMVLKGETALALKRQAIKEGMKTLRMSAMTKVAEGATTFEEGLSMTMES